MDKKQLQQLAREGEEERLAENRRRSEEWRRVEFERMKSTFEKMVQGKLLYNRRGPQQIADKSWEERISEAAKSGGVELELYICNFDFVTPDQDQPLLSREELQADVSVLCLMGVDWAQKFQLKADIRENGYTWRVHVSWSACTE